MKNFYILTINILERKLLAPSSHWDPPIYTKKKWSNIPKCDKELKIAGRKSKKQR